jgi:hypothetical protein
MEKVEGGESCVVASIPIREKTLAAFSIPSILGMADLVKASADKTGAEPRPQKAVENLFAYLQTVMEQLKAEAAVLGRQR